MSDSFPAIKSIVIRVKTDKPVRKTPYQVKGVFMRQFPDESIVPMLNGSLRDKFLYPRVQVKILNEQIFIIGINEGVEPVLKISKKFKAFDFGNITFEIESFDIEESENQFIPSEKLLKYEFVTPWVALNHMTGGKYRFLGNQEKPSFLNKLIGQNIIFLSNELGVKLSDDIFTRVSLTSSSPKPVDDNKWGAFLGSFETNFILPSYIGVGNGITRGFGTIFGVFNQDKLSFNEKMKSKYSSRVNGLINSIMKKTINFIGLFYTIKTMIFFNKIISTTKGLIIYGIITTLLMIIILYTNYIKNQIKY